MDPSEKLKLERLRQEEVDLQVAQPSESESVTRGCVKIHHLKSAKQLGFTEIPLRAFSYTKQEP